MAVSRVVMPHEKLDPEQKKSSQNLLDSNESTKDLLKSSMKGMSFEEGENKLVPPPLLSQPNQPQQKQPLKKDEPQKEQPRVQPQQQPQRQLAPRSIISAFESAESGLALASMRGTTNERVTDMLAACNSMYFPPGLKSAVANAINQVAQLGPLAPSKGETRAYESIEKSSKLSGRHAELKYGGKNLLKKGLSKVRRFGVSLQMVAHGERGRVLSGRDTRKEKLDGYLARCSESIKGYLPPVLLQLQGFCAEVLKATNENVFRPAFITELTKALASLRQDASVDEQQQDQGGHAQNELFDM